MQNLKPSGDQQCVLATIKCKLEKPDWSQNQQHFHWDDSFTSECALHWGDGDLSVIILLSVNNVATNPAK